MRGDSGVDPKFPAVFQRGYQGGGDAVQGAAAKPVVSPPAAAESAPAPAAVSAPEPNRSGETDVRAERAEPVEPRANPFVGVLWLVSVALSGGGGWLVFWSQTRQNQWSSTGPEPFEFILFQIAYMVSGPFITAGLLGIMGLLFWHAADWRRRAIAHSEYAAPQHPPAP